jgi:hypothetical protein
VAFLTGTGAWVAKGVPNCIRIVFLILDRALVSKQ